MNQSRGGKLAKRREPSSTSGALAAGSGNNTRNSGVLVLETFLPYRLNHLSTRVSDALSAIYTQKYGITVPEWRVLATVGQQGRITARDVGRHSVMHKTMVSRAVAALENRKFITRTANPCDKREMFLEMRPDGQSAYDAIVPQARRFSEHIEDGLSTEQRDAFDTAVNILLKRLDQMEITGQF